MEPILKTLGSTFLSLREFGFCYGVQGILFRQNLERLWLQKCVTMSKYNVFLIPPNALSASLTDLNDVGLNSVPFGVAEIEEVKNTWNQHLVPPKSKTILHKIAKVTTVYESDDAVASVKDLFYTKQRERKSWWRKISENPSIYHLSELKKERGKEIIEIEARLPTGNIVVETIQFKRNAQKFFEDKDGSMLRIVEHVTSLDWGCLTLLCDGYIEIEGSKELQMHPTLVPYKVYCKAIISDEDDEITKKDLNDLTLYLDELLREKGVESIIMNNAKKPEKIHSAYIITVNNESLKTGLVKLVCQRTLCGETVHITEIAQRVFYLCYQA